MREEIERGFTISDLQCENQANLTLEQTNKRPCLKNDVTFALLIAIFPHTVTMFNDINNFLGLDIIFNGEPIRLKNHANRQNGNNIGENSSKGGNRL
jgi:hypothetical protein